MMKLTWEQTQKSDFVNALVKLASTAGLEQVTAYRAGRLLDACRRAADRCRNKEKQIIEAGFALKDVDGKIVYDSDNFPEVEPKQKVAFRKVFDQMTRDNSFEIKILPLDYQHVIKANLPPILLIALEPVMTGLPSDETGEVVFHDAEPCSPPKEPEVANA